MIETVTRLNQAVGLLTRPSKHCVIDPITGKREWITADPLLVQLVLAVRNSSSGAVFKSGAVNPPLPFSADALDLFTSIDETIYEKWWQLHALHHGQGGGALSNRLRTWAAVSQSDPDLTREAEQIMTGWVRDIKVLLDPVRRAQIIGACPECQTHRIVSRRDDDGGTITDTALTLVYVDDYPDHAMCQFCGFEWRGYGMTVLAGKMTEAIATEGETA